MPHHYRSKMCLRWTGSCKTAVVTNTAHKQTNKHTEHIYTRYTCNDLNYVWLSRQFRTKRDSTNILSGYLFFHLLLNWTRSVRKLFLKHKKQFIRWTRILNQNFKGFFNWFQSNDQCTWTKVAFLWVGRMWWWNEHKTIKSSDSPSQTGQCDSVWMNNVTC